MTGHARFTSREARCAVGVVAAGVHAGTGDMLGYFLLLGSAARAPTPFERDLLQTVSRLAMLAVEHRQMADRMTHQAQHDG